MKIAQRGIDIELRKKFQGMEFRDFNELATKVTKYEEFSRKKANKERPPWELTVRRSIMKKLQ